ncbi:MAG: PadR family transcriptional regulator [Candidatus Micrarchaeaceae archaeon]
MEEGHKGAGGSRHWLGYMSRDMQRTVIKIIIMSKLRLNKEMYAYAILKELGRIKHPFVKDNPQIKNEVYNILKSLEQAGYIKQKGIVEGKRLKVYYSLTNEGLETLKETKRVLRETARNMKRIFG